MIISMTVLFLFIMNSILYGQFSNFTVVTLLWKIMGPEISSGHHHILLSTAKVWLTFSANWCQHWFEYFPNPPINMLGMVENVLAHYDKDLLQHLVRHGITSQVSPIQMAPKTSHVSLSFSSIFIEIDRPYNQRAC